MLLYARYGTPFAIGRYAISVDMQPRSFRYVQLPVGSLGGYPRIAFSSALTRGLATKPRYAISVVQQPLGHTQLVYLYRRMCPGCHHLRVLSLVSPQELHTSDRATSQSESPMDCCADQSCQQ